MIRAARCFRRVPLPVRFPATSIFLNRSFSSSLTEQTKLTEDEHELKSIFTELHAAHQLQFTGTQSMSIISQVKNKLSTLRSEEQETAMHRWLRLWNGRSFFESRRVNAQSHRQVEQEVAETFLSVVRDDALVHELEKQLKDNVSDWKNIAALANLLYQYSPGRRY